MAFINLLPVADSDGRAVVVEATPGANDPYNAGIRYLDSTADGSLHILTGAIPAGATFQGGWAHDATGALCVLIDAPPAVGSRFYNDGILGDALGHMCLTAVNAIANYSHGWPVDAIGQVCITGGSPPPPTETITHMIITWPPPG